MSDKETVLEAVRRLPDDASLQSIAEEIELLAAIREGEEAAHKGQVTPHEEMKQSSVHGLRSRLLH